jgi:hypothetical protein
MRNARMRLPLVSCETAAGLLVLGIEKTPLQFGVLYKSEPKTALL